MIKFFITQVLIFLSFGMKKHPLTLLMTLELLIVFIMTVTLIMGTELFLVLLLICVGACEGAVGLGSLVCMSRMKVDLLI